MSDIRGSRARKSAPPVAEPPAPIDESLLDEPLSLAEELAEEADRGYVRDDTDDRYEQIKQGDIHIAELQRMSMPQLIEAGAARKSHRNHRHQEAGPDFQDPQRAREAQRLDVRRGNAGNSARWVRLPAQPGLSLSFVPRRYLRFAQPDSPLRLAHRGDRFGPDPPAEGKRALFRPAARRGDQLSRPEPAFRESFLRRSHAAASRSADRAGNHARGSQHARDRSDRADRVRAARVDRQPAAGRQNDPAAKDGQGRAHQLSGELRDHAVDRRAAGRSDRHGAASEGPELRGDQLDVRRSVGPAHPSVGNGDRKGQADGGIRLRRGDLSRFDHAAGSGVERRSARTPARFSPAASMPMPCSGRSDFSARPAKSKKAAR